MLYLSREWQPYREPPAYQQQQSPHQNPTYSTTEYAPGNRSHLPSFASYPPRHYPISLNESNVSQQSQSNGQYYSQTPHSYTPGWQENSDCQSQNTRQKLTTLGCVKSLLLYMVSQTVPNSSLLMSEPIMSTPGNVIHRDDSIGMHSHHRPDAKLFQSASTLVDYGGISTERREQYYNQYPAYGNPYGVSDSVPSTMSYNRMHTASVQHNNMSLQYRANPIASEMQQSNYHGGFNYHQQRPNSHTADYQNHQQYVPVHNNYTTGTKYALVIGVNYYNMEYSQTSNIGSAYALCSMLVNRFGYLEKNIVLLSDDQNDTTRHPTYRVIASSIKKMMSMLQPNDSVFFYFCGFGSLPLQLLERQSEIVSHIQALESDYILPSDFEEAGAISSSYLYKYLVNKLPQTARLTAVFNCLVAGTGLGVPYKCTHPGVMTVASSGMAGSKQFESEMQTDPSQRFNSSWTQQDPLNHMSTNVPVGGSSGPQQTLGGNIMVFGWDRNYNDPEHKNYLTHTPNNSLGGYWMSAMEKMKRHNARVTLGDILGYINSLAMPSAMLPFVASGRRIRMEDEFVL